MPEHPNKLIQFWKELKRRRVVHIITVYASAAFVLIELANNLTGPLSLPSGLATVVIIILAAGFPLVIILSWMYDLSGRGMERTKPLSKAEKDTAREVSVPWKIATYISIVVIAGLVTLNIIEGKRSLRPGDIRSMVILPFDNFTGDDRLDYAAAGMHASLIRDMGRIGNLRVIGKTSANAVKKMDLSLPEIARELHVEAVVEPTVMCYGDTVCVQIRVMTLYPKEKLLWVADYKEDRSQIPNLYNQISRKIAAEIMVELTPDEEQMLAKTRSVDREAYDAYLRSYQYWDDLSGISLNKAREYLNSAMVKDPEWAALYTGLARVWMALVQNGFESQETAGSKIHDFLAKAIQLDPDNAENHSVTAMIALTEEWNWPKAEREFMKALAMNPNESLTRMYYAHLLMALQRPREALEQARLAFDLDPLNPVVRSIYSVVLLGAGKCKAAIANVEKVIVNEPENFGFNQILSLAAFRCKDYDKVIQAEKFNLKGHFGSQFEEDTYTQIERIYAEEGFAAAYEKILLLWEELADSTFMFPVDMAVAYIRGNYKEKAMDLIEQGYEMRDPSMLYVPTPVFPFDSLYDNQRFITVVEKLNLPRPVQ